MTPQQRSQWLRAHASAPDCATLRQMEEVTNLPPLAPLTFERVAEFAFGEKLSAEDVADLTKHIDGFVRGFISQRLRMRGVIE